jgi:hypothetical protein
MIHLSREADITLKTYPDVDKDKRINPAVHHSRPTEAVTQTADTVATAFITAYDAPTKNYTDMANLFKPLNGVDAAKAVILALRGMVTANRLEDLKKLLNDANLTPK